jgi:hypothetical protein
VRLKTSIITALATAIAATPALAAISPFATEVVSSVGYPNPTGPYANPEAVLGKPTTKYNVGSPGSPSLARAKLIEGIYGTDAAGQPLITTVEFGQQITVKFDHRVENDPDNPFGLDLIVFGNAFFGGNGFSSESTNLNAFKLNGNVFAEPMRISVSQDGQTFHTFESGPFADDLFPTNAYRWDKDGARWTDVEADFTRPVDPSLTAASFAGMTAADALDLYNGSGGGTGFDIGELNLAWIQYVRVEGVGPSYFDGEIDAFADVAPVPEPTTLAALVAVAAIGRRRRR